jgi:hypothetical protein
MGPIRKGYEYSPKRVCITGRIPSSLVDVNARRAALLLMALALVLLGFARLADPELRFATKAVLAEAATVEAERPAVERTLVQSAPGGTRVKAVRLRYLATPFKTSPRPASSLAPASRPSGGDAFGTSAPRRKRWAVLGGHGRHGAG